VVQVAQFTQHNKPNGTVMASFQKTATILFYRKYEEQTSSIEMSILTSNENDDDDDSRFSTDEDYNDSDTMIRNTLTLTVKSITVQAISIQTILLTLTKMLR
jgi:hypothetical protein